MPRTTGNRAGFTLIEVVIALGILATVVLMLAPSAQRFMSTTAKSQRRMQASAAAEAQIALVRMFPDYTGLVTRFDATENNTPRPGWTRRTRVVRTGAGTRADITRITVTVSGQDLDPPITRSVSIAAP
jgi:prepilin-type N-terminal cleavage/methylation domain-containing protein